MGKKKDNMLPDYPGYYLSKRGVLWSRHIKPNGLGDTWYKIKISLNRKKGGKNYIGRARSVIYNYKGKRVHINISREVAKLYVNNPCPSYNVVCHKDNDPSNNHYKNLYWGTQRINMRQMVEDGRSMVGDLNIGSKLTNNETYQLISIYLKREGKLQEEIAKDFNITKSGVKHIIKKYRNNQSIWRK